MKEQMNLKEIPLCTQCAYVITNPICPRCFSRHVLYWLRDKKTSSKEIKQILKQLKQLIKKADETPSNINCIICGSKKVNLCLHCFTFKAEKIIENNTNPTITQEFEEDFNTILWRI